MALWLLKVKSEVYQCYLDDHRNIPRHIEGIWLTIGKVYPRYLNDYRWSLRSFSGFLMTKGKGLRSTSGIWMTIKGLWSTSGI